MNRDFNNFINRDFNNFIKLIETGAKISSRDFKVDNINTNSSRDLEKIELICNRFHNVALQMRARYNSRPTLEIKDEYDIQDLESRSEKIELKVIIRP